MRLPSKSGWFAILMTLSAVSVFALPRDWTDWLRRFFQPRALLQLAGTRVTNRVHDAVAPHGRTALSAEEVAALQAEVAELRRALGHQSLRLEEQERLLEAVTGLRDQMPVEDLALVITPVIAHDADPRKESVQVVLRRKQRESVRRGQWAVSGAPDDRWREQPLRLFRRWLVGQVVEVHPWLARIRLATDPGFMTAVHLARELDDGTWEITPESYRLVGRGRDRMLVDQARRDYFAEGWRIVVVPASGALPIPLSIGRVVGSVPRDDSPLHVDLLVEPWEPMEELEQVYILAPGE